MHEANAATLKSPLFIQLKPASDLVRFTCSPIVPAVTPEFQGCELGGTLLSTFNSDQRISLQLAVFSMISNPNLQLRALPNHKRFALQPASSDTTKQALRLPWTPIVPRPATCLPENRTSSIYIQTRAVFAVKLRGRSLGATELDSDFSCLAIERPKRWWILSEAVSDLGSLFLLKEKNSK
jgi:hypothetical protein